VAAELHRVVREGTAPGKGGQAGPRLLASPLRRALETAEIVARGLGAEELDIEIREELSLDAGTPLSLVAEISTRRDDVLLVGHQPNVEGLVRALLWDGDPQALRALVGGFCTAMVVGLELHESGNRWELHVVVDPRTLA
jgi:phosphohistidine phosphatase